MGGPGSRFWFEIDLPELVWDPIPAKVEKRNIIGYTPLIPEKRKALKVLIVDDQPENRLVLKDVLLPLGFDVSEATDGHAALTGAKEFQPDLILMDLLLPDLDGFEATKRIRQMSELKDTIILAVSASAFEETRHESLAAGCDDYFTKPLQVDEILDHLRTYLHLEWIYEEDSTAQSSLTNQAKEPIVPPPETALTGLHALVSIGDLDELQNQVIRLTATDPEFIPFATKIQQLAAEFRLDDLQGFIEHFLEEQDD
jgi:CheY-like chemotaxis protein